MARGRMISRSLGSSRKFARLGGVPDLGDFSQALYQLLIANADDFGRLDGDAFSVKFGVFPTSRRTEEEFEQALAHIAEVDLIVRYDAGGKACLQIVDFEVHQSLERRTKSKWPPPPGVEAPFSASEAEVEALIAERLEDGTLRIGDLQVASVERQVRIGSSYLDIVCKTFDGPTILVEVKRQRVSLAAIEQVARYVDLLNGAGVRDVVPVLIGHGLAADLPLSKTHAIVAVYDDALQFRAVTTLDVKSRQLTLVDVKSRGGASQHAGKCQPASSATEPNRTEPKGTEPNRNSDNRRDVSNPKRAAGPTRPSGRQLPTFEISDSEFDSLFDRIREITGEDDTKAKRALYRHYVEHLGVGGVEQALGSTKDRKLDTHQAPLRNAGAYLNRACQDIARERGIALGKDAA